MKRILQTVFLISLISLTIFALSKTDESSASAPPASAVSKQN